MLVFITPTPTIIAFTVVTKAHGPSIQPTLQVSNMESIWTAAWSYQALGNILTCFAQEDGGANQLPTYLGQSHHLCSPWWSSLSIITIKSLNFKHGANTVPHIFLLWRGPNWFSTCYLLDLVIHFTADLFISLFNMTWERESFLASLNVWEGSLNGS